ncbi:MAG TPA: hypothetical protein PKD64_19810 [Pirellulaceae bacterium]|nr:hypothetical protein [Pirellulaceae bacterium]HMO94437.1 hypothetical protein [Pirellulaceae bacterium]
MNTSSENPARLSKLIEQGEEVLRTHRPNSPGVIGFPTLDTEAFYAWQTRCVAFLQQVVGTNHTYTKQYTQSVTEPYTGATKAGIGILKAALADLCDGFLDQSPPVNPLRHVENICDKFHQVARTIRSRHGARPTLEVSDEYDVQDLVHSLLFIHFDDVRPEEVSPSYAGKSSRMDFLLKNEQIVVEIKKTRAGLGAKEIGTQLIEDIERYKTHPDCKLLVCFVYDPEGLAGNPRGIENDLNRDNGPFPVRVLIRP